MASPATYQDAITWLGDPSNWWTDTVGGTLVTDGGAVQHAETDIASRVLTQATAGLRPIYTAADESLYFAGGDRLELASSEALFNNVHKNGTFHCLFAFKNDDSAATRYYTANHAVGAGSSGFQIMIDAADVLSARVRIAGTYRLLILGPTVSDTDWHICEVIFSPQPGGSRLRVDNGEWYYDEWDATYPTGSGTDSDAIFTIGSRPGGTSPALARIRQMVIGDGRFSNTQVLDWRSQNALYNSALAPARGEVFVGDMRVCLDNERAWTLENLEYKGYTTVRGYDAASHQGTIFSLTPPNDFVGSGHGGEVATTGSVVIDGQAVAFPGGDFIAGGPGGVWSGNTVVVTRNTTFNTTTFDLTSVQTYRANGSYREVITITRKSPSDGATVQTAYVYTSPRQLTMNLFASYDNTGATVDTGDFNALATDATYDFPAGAVAYAAFDPDAGIGLVTTCVDDGGLTPGFDVQHRTNDNKFHGTMGAAGVGAIAAGASVTAIWEFAHFEATAETFENVARGLVRQAFGSTGMAPILHRRRG
jgi:hypothetical protein